MARLGTAIVFLAIPIFASCGVESNQATQAQIKDLSEKVESLKKSVETLQGNVSVDRLVRDGEVIAYLTPGDNGYSTIRTDFGPLTVSLEDIKPYANGSRVTLKFGNPTSATLNDVSATLQWGTVDDKGSPQNDSEHSKEFSFNRSFNAGHWTSIEVVLDGVQASNLGFVRVTDLNNKGIVLLK